MPRPPVGSTDTKDLTKLELQVELNGLDWAKVGAALGAKILGLKEVAVVTVGKEGRMTLELEAGKELDEKTVKKYVKEAGFKFKSLKDPEAEDEPEFEPEEEDPIAVD